MHILAKSVKCYCDECEDNAPEDGKCETEAGGFCFSSVKAVLNTTTGQYEEERLIGCMSSEQNGGFLQVNLNYSYNIFYISTFH